MDSWSCPLQCMVILVLVACTSSQTSTEAPFSSSLSPPSSTGGRSIGSTSAQIMTSTSNNDNLETASSSAAVSSTSITDGQDSTITGLMETTTVSSATEDKSTGSMKPTVISTSDQMTTTVDQSVTQSSMALETTAAPIETITAPIATTAAPIETATAPIETTAAPVETTTAPIATTATPIETTTAPIATTAAPIETTTAPIETTATPIETTTATTAAPIETTTAPIETTTAPIATTAAPIETTTAPIETTTTPIETTAAPIATTAAPIETATAPIATTAAPNETTAAPIETTTILITTLPKKAVHISFKLNAGDLMVQKRHVASWLAMLKTWLARLTGLAEDNIRNVHFSSGGMVSFDAVVDAESNTTLDAEINATKAAVQKADTTFEGPGGVSLTTDVNSWQETQEFTAACDISRCYNGGTCTSLVQLDFTCTCTASWEGPTCSWMVDIPTYVKFELQGSFMTVVGKNGEERTEEMRGKLAEMAGISEDRVKDVLIWPAADASGISLGFVIQPASLNNETTAVEASRELLKQLNSTLMGWVGDSQQLPYVVDSLSHVRLTTPCAVNRCLYGGQCKASGQMSSCTCTPLQEGKFCEKEKDVLVHISFKLEGIFTNVIGKNQTSWATKMVPYFAEKAMVAANRVGRIAFWDEPSGGIGVWFDIWPANLKNESSAAHAVKGLVDWLNSTLSVELPSGAMVAVISESLDWKKLVDPCDADRCLNNGRCLGSAGGSWECICPREWVGWICQRERDLPYSLSFKIEGDYSAIIDKDERKKEKWKGHLTPQLAQFGGIPQQRIRDVQLLKGSILILFTITSDVNGTGVTGRQAAEAILATLQDNSTVVSGPNGGIYAVIPDSAQITKLLDACTVNQCENGATCQVLNHWDYHCKCQAGWKGTLCNKPDRPNIPLIIAVSVAGGVLLLTLLFILCSWWRKKHPPLMNERPYYDRITSGIEPGISGSMWRTAWYNGYVFNTQPSQVKLQAHKWNSFDPFDQGDPVHYKSQQPPGKSILINGHMEHNRPRNSLQRQSQHTMPGMGYDNPAMEYTQPMTGTNTYDHLNLRQRPDDVNRKGVTTLYVE